MKKEQIKSLFYITHVKNVGSIVKRGILSHGTVDREKIPYVPIYDKEIVSNPFMAWKVKRRTVSGDEFCCFLQPTCIRTKRGACALGCVG